MKKTSLKPEIVAVLLVITILAFCTMLTAASTQSSFSKLYGGKLSDHGYSIAQASDGGYVIVGDSNSFSYGHDAMYVVKTDVDGNQQWGNFFTWYFNSGGRSITQTTDGGYVIAGYIDSPAYPQLDTNRAILLVKINASKNMHWYRTFDGPYDDAASCVIQTSDGGYAVVGETSSFGTQNRTLESDYNIWLIKTDANGNTMWSQTYGESGNEYGYTLIQTSDGGYAVAGITDVSGSVDMYLVKTDLNGTVMWNQTYGGTGFDCGQSLVQTSDGGYLIAGYTNSFGSGNYDVFLIKTDAEGNLQLNQTLGGAKDDRGYSIIKTSDNGYAVAGCTASFGAGDYDIWLIKTNSTGSMIWNQTYGGTDRDWSNAVIQIGDGGYALVGYTRSFDSGYDDVCLIKTDADGVAPMPTPMPTATPQTAPTATPKPTNIPIFTASPTPSSLLPSPTLSPSPSPILLPSPKPTVSSTPTMQPTIPPNFPQAEDDLKLPSSIFLIIIVVAAAAFIAIAAVLAKNLKSNR